MSARAAFATLVAAALAGCVIAPTRDDPGAFIEHNAGKVRPADTRRFVSCLADGFEKSHSMFTDIHTRQQIRGDGIRVETVFGKELLVSADVFDDGRVVLYEAAHTHINTKDEHKAFATCLEKYASK